MDEEIAELLRTAIWIGKSLFDRNKTAGSSANLSFRCRDSIYITGSGTCFGALNENSFAVVDLDGKHVEGLKPSKELPLHALLYERRESVRAVIHVHSFYATLWSCLEHGDPTDCVPAYTPYLKMKLGTVGLIPYGKPGSPELFGAFEKAIAGSDGYLLRNHGPVVGGSDLMEAFYCMEELEESARIAWELRNEHVPTI